MTKEELRKEALSLGASDVGFCKVDDGPGGLNYAVSIVIRLSDAICDEITDAPTHTYFNHYRQVNALIDQILLKIGLLIQNEGHTFITVAASQSINKDGWNFCGRYSHKKAACLCGLGSIGKNSLFLHKNFGARVRLGTLFTSMPLCEEAFEPVDICLNCDKCVKACPSGAILGKKWEKGILREEIFDPQKCSSYMKDHFKMIGRGAVCGICMSVCPAAKKRNI